MIGKNKRRVYVTLSLEVLNALEIMCEKGEVSSKSEAAGVLIQEALEVRKNAETEKKSRRTL